MPRAPLAAFFGLVFGTMFLGLGLAVLGWVWTAHTNSAQGLDWARWAAQQAPREWKVDAERFGNGAIKNMVPAGMIAALITFMGLILLVSAPRHLRPSDTSSGQRGRIAFKSPPPRPGRRLEGSIRLLGPTAPGEIYEVSLKCTRTDSDGGENEVFSRGGEVQATRGADGLHLPFSFEVPVSAPPSFGTVGLLGFPVRHEWRIHFRKQGKWFGGGFELRMEPPSDQEALIRLQRLAWKIFSWAIVAYVAVFHALPFVAGEISGTNK